MYVLQRLQRLTIRYGYLIIQNNACFTKFENLRTRVRILVKRRGSLLGEPPGVSGELVATTQPKQLKKILVCWSRTSSRPILPRGGCRDARGKRTRRRWCSRVWEERNVGVVRGMRALSQRKTEPVGWRLPRATSKQNKQSKFSPELARLPSHHKCCQRGKT